MFDEIRKDYERHGSSFLNPALWAVWNYRFGRWALGLRFALLRWSFSKLYGMNQFILKITSGIQIPREAQIGQGFHIIHGQNIIIHPDVVIGDRCGIMHNVTIGTNMKSGAPRLGDDVFLGAGAVVIGRISIGNQVIIGANSLVKDDVPDDVVMLGVPAREVQTE